ncbi:hypothetical protein RIF29_17002 [Crotalaria pallida]|uniref:Uncharacterized protein n=1 Tax=Crotalaria pallida TaxID=3830 RepID=A0AAN9IK76_CROPI
MFYCLYPTLIWVCIIQNRAVIANFVFIKYPFIHNSGLSNFKRMEINDSKHYYCCALSIVQGKHWSCALNLLLLDELAIQ